VLVENKFGVLARVAGLFSGRGYNIESLSVAPTLDSTVSRMTIVTSGDDRVLEQINKQLNKLIDVIKVWDVTQREFVDRELVLIRVDAKKETRDEVFRLAQLFEAKVAEVGERSVTLEACGNEARIEDFIRLLKPLGIREFVRSGRVAILKSDQK
jgi:acetolactate synthase-1/3 small subunit